MSFRALPRFRDLQAFLDYLGRKGELLRIAEPVSTVHEMTEIHRRVLAGGGPALLFERPVKADGCIADTPMLVNLFGTLERVAWGLGVEASRLADLGVLLAALRAPRPMEGLRTALEQWPLVKAAFATVPTTVNRPPVQQRAYLGSEVDLARFPIQTCWPDEPAPLITWPLVITRPPDAGGPAACNMGVYRVQVLDRDRAIVRWLAHRGGAAHHRLWQEAGRDMPIAIAIGADPATILSAVLPLPEGVSEFAFSGVLKGERPRLARGLTVPLPVPADAEIVIEGEVSAHETAPEGPFGDHTGYYNAVERFPVMKVTAITSRSAPIYLSTYTGRPPDEPSIIGEALNELALPVLRQEIPEIVDCWLPPDACSYRMAVVSIRKRYAGQARRVMMALWALLVQFCYTKIIVVVDDDIDVRSWRDISWALATRMDPSRDLLIAERTPIDDLDFASPLRGLGGKLGIDATRKIGSETDRLWGKVLTMDPAVARRVDALWPQLGIGGCAPALEGDRR